MQRPFDRPDLDQELDQLAMFVDGTLPIAQPVIPYEGRLQIHNGFGECRADLFEGTLPPGHTISVDQGTDEVVISWPAAVLGVAPIVNPGFEDGTVGWDYGAGWGVTTDNPATGVRTASYGGQRGESRLSSRTRVRVTPGTPITAGCTVTQGASSAGNAGAAVLLEYRNAAGEVISTREGNRVMSASNNARFPSTVNDLVPGDAYTVNIACLGIRWRQNLAVWVDDFHWTTEAAEQGIDHDALFPITIRVRDQRGRVAFWSGTIRVREISPENAIPVPTSLAQLFGINGGGAWDSAEQQLQNNFSGITDISEPWARIFCWSYTTNFPEAPLESRAIIYDQVNQGGSVFADTGWHGNPANQTAMTAALSAAGLSAYNGVIAASAITERGSYDSYLYASGVFVLPLDFATHSLRSVGYRSQSRLDRAVYLERPNPAFLPPDAVKLIGFPGYYETPDGQLYLCAWEATPVP